MPRKDLTLKNKIAILNEIKSQPSNTSLRRLAEIINVPKSTISRLLKEEKQLHEKWMLHEEKPGTSRRKRDGKDPDVEEALDRWFSEVIQQDVRSINGTILKAKAEELAKKLNHNDFKATDGWLSRWKTRRNIKFKKMQGEKSSADNKSAKEWKNTKVPTYLSTYSPDEIYNADETGLYYRASPDGSLCYEHIALSGYKKAMDRITVLCCTNMSGSDKRKLLVIGKSSKPRCFKELRIEGLPVEYHANKNARMTSEIFRNWLTTWDVKLQHKQRKILLLVDNCTAHQHLELKNIQLEFLPANTASLVQPMDMGIIKHLKTLYRGKLVNYILESIDENLLTSTTTAMEISSKINILLAIQFVADSWRAIKISTIQNCFGYCGLKSTGIPEQDSDEEYEISQVLNYLEFSIIDTNLPCYDENGDCGDAIVEGIESENQKLEEHDDSDEEDLPTPVTKREAKQCIDRLQRYFMQDENDGSPMSAINICADFVQLQSRKKRTQTTLDKFF